MAIGGWLRTICMAWKCEHCDPGDPAVFVGQRWTYPWFHFYGARPINGPMPAYDGHTIDYYIDPWDEFVKKLKDGKMPVFTIWFSER